MIDKDQAAEIGYKFAQRKELQGRLECIEGRLSHMATTLSRAAEAIKGESAFEFTNSGSVGTALPSVEEIQEALRSAAELKATLKELNEYCSQWENVQRNTGGDAPPNPYRRG